MISTSLSSTFSEGLYSEKTRQVDRAHFHPGDRFSIQAEMLDICLAENEDMYFAFEVGNTVVIAAPTDEFDLTRDDVFDWIDVMVTFDVIVGEDYKLSVTDVRNEG